MIWRCDAYLSFKSVWGIGASSLSNDTMRKTDFPDSVPSTLVHTICYGKTISGKHNCIDSNYGMECCSQ